MKKLLTMAALVGVASLSFGQGTVNFSAGSTAATRIYTNGVAQGLTSGQIAGASGSFYFALFVAPSTVTSLSGNDPTLGGFSFTGYIGTNTAVGRFSGNPTTDDCAIAGYLTGTSASFVVAGWSGNIASDWASVQKLVNNQPGAPVFTGTPWYGVSAVATSVALGGGLSFPGNIFGANSGQISGFNLTVVPEPSTFALAGLGAAALLIFRRRK